MRSRSGLRVATVIAAIVAAQSVAAAPCAGFDDVDTGSVFCPNVDWLKNRAITLGCTPATNYCPSAIVNRLSMAAFMNRLGVALTPSIVYSEGSGATFDLDAAPAAVCATASIAAETFPRSAHVGAVLTARFDATSAVAALKVVQSTDGGTTWTPLNAIPTSFGGAAKWANAAAWKGAVSLDPGASYRFGLRVERAASGGSGNLADWNCAVKAMVTSRTGTAAPF
jgi:hypothetical protein